MGSFRSGSYGIRGVERGLAAGPRNPRPRALASYPARTHGSSRMSVVQAHFGFRGGLESSARPVASRCAVRGSVDGMALICSAVVPRERFTTTPGDAKGSEVSAGSVT